MDEKWSLFKNLDEHILEIIRETMAEHLTSEQFYLNGRILGPLLEKILPAYFRVSWVHTIFRKLA
jgi:hypothetical protein